MTEYIPTFKACNMLGLGLNQSSRLTHDFKIRSKKDFTYKVWNLDDINAELERRRRHKNPPDGWIRMDDAAELIGWSAPVARSIMLAHGLTPELKKIWTKGKKYRMIPCWNARAVRQIAAEIRRSNRKLPPEGWLTFSDVRDYLGAGTARTRTWLRKFKVGYKKVNNRRFFYAEDDVVALRKYMKTHTSQRPELPNE